MPDALLRDPVVQHAGLIDEARIAVTDSKEFSDVVNRNPAAGRM